ncbi:alcohol dehydrogenase catalytic domain-containing protein [Kitasatospora sp. NPDC090308]|uniref:alcohol dehydrogenase catalytic domain-containing protein n=1 Tax=Kitasatospora sp. NPDC090308 TaxID=3364082 RepID=UPI003827FD64
MRAVGFRVNGGVEVLEELDVPEPVPAAGQVTVRVAFAGVNFAEVQHRRGEFGAPDGPHGVDVPGLEVAGAVSALGPGVTGLSVGEPVAAYLPAFGGYAELAVADARSTRSLQTAAGEVDPAHAAALPCVYPTAFGILDDAGRLRPDEDVLIHSAAQLARALGARRVFGTVGSAGKIPYALSLGYDDVFLRDDFTAP